MIWILVELLLFQEAWEELLLLTCWVEDSINYLLEDHLIQLLQEETTVF